VSTESCVPDECKMTIYERNLIALSGKIIPRRQSFNIMSSPAGVTLAAGTGENLIDINVGGPGVFQAFGQSIVNPDADSWNDVEWSVLVNDAPINPYYANFTGRLGNCDYGPLALAKLDFLLDDGDNIKVYAYNNGSNTQVVGAVCVGFTTPEFLKYHLIEDVCARIKESEKTQ